MDVFGLIFSFGWIWFMQQGAAAQAAGPIIWPAEGAFGKSVKQCPWRGQAHDFLAVQEEPWMMKLFRVSPPVILVKRVWNTWACCPWDGEVTTTSPPGPPRVPPPLPLMLATTLWSSDSGGYRICGEVWLDFEREDPQEKKVAIQLLALAHPNERVRLSGVIRLSQFKETYVVDALCESVVADPCSAVREAAVRSLAKIGNPRSLPALDWAAEHDPDREVREMAGFTVEILQRRAIDSESVAPVGFFRMIGGCGVPPAALAAKDAEPVIWPGDSIGSVGSLGCPWRGSVSDVSGIEDPLFQVEARPWEKYWERTEDPAVTDPPPMVTPPLPSVEDAEWAWLASAPPTHIYRMGSCWGGPDRWDGDVWLEIAPYRQALEHQEERIRLDSVIHLGRFRACGDDLAILLKADPSPVVREAAATSLAQVGDPAALLALQWAAEHDSDRDVRRTARFAAEILQGRLELMLKPEDQRLMPEIMPGSMFEPRMIGG